MAECMFGSTRAIEIPPRRSLSSKKYYCHLCRRNTPVTEEDIKCSICQTQFVEEVTPDTDLNDFRRLGEDLSRSSDLDRRTTLDESSEGPLDLRSSRRLADDSEPMRLANIVRRHETSDPFGLNRYQRLAESFPRSHLRSSGLPSVETAASASVEGAAQQRIPERTLDDICVFQSSDDDNIDDDEYDSDDSEDVDIETVSPLMQENFSSLIRRTIRRTLLDFEQRNDPHPEILMQSIEGSVEGLRARERASEAPDGRSRVGERAQGAPIERSLILPLIAEISENIHPRGGFQELFQLAGNIGDYALGREWDTIISQILNEGEVSVSSRLDITQIEVIPRIAIKEADVLNLLQCTICLEDFQMAEMVKNLPCTHLFHDDCIVPWLQLHDSCPICRKKVNIEEQSSH